LKVFEYLLFVVKKSNQTIGKCFNTRSLVIVFFISLVSELISSGIINDQVIKKNNNNRNYKLKSCSYSIDKIISFSTNNNDKNLVQTEQSTLNKNFKRKKIIVFIKNFQLKINDKLKQINKNTKYFYPAIQLTIYEYLKNRKITNYTTFTDINNNTRSKVTACLKQAKISNFQVIIISCISNIITELLFKTFKIIQHTGFNEYSSPASISIKNTILEFFKGNNNNFRKKFKNLLEIVVNLTSSQLKSAASMILYEKIKFFIKKFVVSIIFLCKFSCNSVNKSLLVQ
jgi:hypothetical protein